MRTLLFDHTADCKVLAGLCLVLLALFPAAVLGQEGKAGSEGIGLAENPASPLHAPTHIELEELWRVGGDSEEEGEFFGVIADVAVDEAGEVYLLDRQLSEVRVFGPDGVFLRSIGREGEGPGEFRQPVGLFFLPDGRLAVIQRRPARLVLLEKDGLPAGTIEFPEESEGIRNISSGSCRGGNIVLLGSGFKRSEDGFERSRSLVRMDAQGRQIVTYRKDNYQSQRGRLRVVETEGFTFSWALGPEGKVFASTDFDYRIQVWEADGGVEKTITREYEPYLRSDAEIEEETKRLGAGMRFRGRRPRMEPDVVVSDREPGVRWLDVDDAGYLWVLSGRARKEAMAGEPLRFDIYDPEGRWLQTVALGAEIDPVDDRLVRRGDRLFVLRQFVSAINAMFGRESEEKDWEEEAEPMSVVCYRLDWTAPTTP